MLLHVYFLHTPILMSFIELTILACFKPNNICYSVLSTFKMNSNEHVSHYLYHDTKSNQSIGEKSTKLLIVF